MATVNSNGNGSHIAAVLYLRKSTDKQERSIDDQRKALIEYAQKHGHRIAGEYVDEAISGDDTDRRTGFLRMRNDAEARKFSTVLAWDQDRFGRFDPIEAGYWILPFRKAGVRLETIGQGKIDWDDFAGRISYLVQQEAKHAFLRDLSRNICRAQLARAKEGKGTGGNRIPYGYRVQQTRDDRGKLLDSKLVIEPRHAEVVQRIFREYLAGGSIRGIADDLNADKITAPSPRARNWNTSTIGYMLKNQKYLGRFVWGVQGVGRYNTAATGEIQARHKSDPHIKGVPIVHEDSHEPIIDKRTFDRVQARLPRQQKNGRHKSAYVYIFSGLLRCGDCGANLVGIRTRTKTGGMRYLCRRYGYAGKSACYCNSIAESALLDALIEKLNANYLDDKAIARERQTIIAEHQLDRPLPRKGSHKRRIAELDRMIDQAAEKILAAPKELTATLCQKLEKLRIEREQLAARANEPEPTINIDDVNQAMDALRNLRETLMTANRKDLYELFASFVDRIELRFTHKMNGKLQRSEIDGATVYLQTDYECSIVSKMLLDFGEQRSFEIDGNALRRSA